VVFIFLALTLLPLSPARARPEDGIVRDPAAPVGPYTIFLPLVRRSIRPIIPDTTVVLSEDTTSYLESISPDGSIYTFGQITDELAALDPGDVMVTGVSAKTPFGFLRLVTAVDNAGGKVVVTTSQGTLEDAIQQGELRFSQTLSPAMIAAGSALKGVELQQGPQGEFFYQLIDVVLYFCQVLSRYETISVSLSAKPMKNTGS
jgi:hypothetical protein